MRIPAVAAIVASLAGGPALAADAVEGDWMASAGTRVHITPCRGQPSRLCGDIVWLKTPNSPSGEPLRDISNPDPALRGRAVLGLPFLRDFQRVEAGRWSGGKIYDPKSGKTYDAKMQLNPDGTLKLEGCVAVFCQAQTWTRPS
jgi:uncharacterized protein (DUF2147 family)